MKTLVTITALIIFSTPLSSQCMQEKPNSLFSMKNFIAFTKDVSSGEEKLLSWDFCFKRTLMSKSKKIKYYVYRIDHTLHASNSTNTYHFDVFSVTNDADRVEYNTSSNKNFLAYKKMLMQYKVRGIEGDSDMTIIKYSGKEYLVNIDRTSTARNPSYLITVSAW